MEETAQEASLPLMEAMLVLAEMEEKPPRTVPGIISEMEAMELMEEIPLAEEMLEEEEAAELEILAEMEETEVMLTLKEKLVMEAKEALGLN